MKEQDSGKGDEAYAEDFNLTDFKREAKLENLLAGLKQCSETSEQISLVYSDIGLIAGLKNKVNKNAIEEEIADYVNYLLQEIPNESVSTRTGKILREIKRRFNNSDVTKLLTLRGLSSNLDPEKWFVAGEKGKTRFVPHICAADYLRAFPNTITEYISGAATSQFMGEFWLRNGDDLIRSVLEEPGFLKPAQINEAVESIKNQTRVNPKFSEKSLEEIMPLPTHTIPIEKGLLNLMTGVVMPHNPEYFYTEYIPRKYTRNSVPVYSQKFLDIIFQGDPEAEVKKAQIFETIAWCLMMNYDIHGAVILHGLGGEGKSIIHTILEKLLVHVTSVSLDQLEDKWYRPELTGKWANLISESSAKIIGSEWFKRLTDHTAVKVDVKNGHPFWMRSHAKFIIDTNELPIVKDAVRAFYRRVIAIIEFPNMLEELITPPEILTLTDKLYSESELDALFSYVIDNYYAQLVNKMKFTNHLSVEEAERRWTKYSDPAKVYIEHIFEIGNVFTDTEDVRALSTEYGDDFLVRALFRKRGDEKEYPITIKEDIVNDGKKWANASGLPGQLITASKLTRALKETGIVFSVTDKRIARVKMPAWGLIYIKPLFGESSETTGADVNPGVPTSCGLENWAGTGENSVVDSPQDIQSD